MGTGFPHLSYIFDNSKQADMRRIAGQCACIAYVVVSVWLMVYVSDAFYMGEKKRLIGTSTWNGWEKSGYRVDRRSRIK